MAGLYTKKNLGEVQLNLTEAIQKLYDTGIEDDVVLFAFSSSLYSSISSATYTQATSSNDRVTSLNQIYGLKNEPFFDGEQTVFRTKFVTNNFTFSSENVVYFDHIAPEGFTFDFRQQNDPGAPIKISKDGALVKVAIDGEGSNYQVRTSLGAVVPLPTEVTVGVRGMSSRADDALITITIDADGTLSRIVPPTVLSGGSGYLENEALELIPQCQTDRYGELETPTKNKCKNYSGDLNRLYHTSYDPETKSVGYRALLRSIPYPYVTKLAGEDGFFLYDPEVEDWVYLGTGYNDLRPIPAKPVANLVLKRFDVITSENIANLYKLNSQSNLFSYDDNFSIERGSSEQGQFFPGSDISLSTGVVKNNISRRVKLLSDSVESIRGNLKTLLQNSKRQRVVEDTKNELGIQYNILEGANINSTFRLIMRDPDGVLDREDVDFYDVRDNLKLADEVELTIGEEILHVPGIWINLGERYQRAFSTDDKPFFSIKNRYFISPLLTKLTTGTDYSDSGNYSSRAESGENKYSISTAYLKPGEDRVLGFDTKISVLIQNLSANPANGGFIYHQAMSTPVINSGQNIRGWPLFKYKHSSQEYTPHILGYEVSNVD